MSDADVLVVGAGPTGLMLAGELALAGVRAVIVEKRPDQTLVGQRAGGMHARTVETLELRGIADRFVSQGQTAPNTGFAWMQLGIGDFPIRHPYTLGLWQNRIEAILADWVAELGVVIHRGCEAASMTQGQAGVELGLADGRTLRAPWLVGCDGGRSLARKAAGIDFPGWDPSISCLIAEVRMTDPPPFGLRRDETGLHGFSPTEGGAVRVMVTEREVGRTEAPGLDELSAALTAVFGTDYGVHDPISVSRFTDMTRQASAYRSGRILLAGDAAHIHFPTGGQGLNTGVQDAANLGWKLAQVIKGISPERLLDSYQAERHPVAARVLSNTMAQTALLRGDARIDALRETVGELLKLDEPRRRVAAMITGLDIHYDLGEGHPLLGRFMPDLELTTAEGPVRVSVLLHGARPVALNLGAPGSLAIGGWADRVRLAEAEYADTWALPVLGEVPAPTAVLTRPDGYVAWVGEGSDEGLAQALETWFGAASA